MSVISRGYYKRKNADGEFEVIYLYSDATAIAETSERKFVTPTEKANWNAKIGGVKVNGTALSVDSNNSINIDLSDYSKKDNTIKSIKLSAYKLTAVLANGATEEIGTVDVLGAPSGLSQGGTIGQILEEHDRALANTVSLDSNNLIPSKYIPGTYDDVLEYSAYSNLPSAGETGKLYVTTGDNKVYRWSGSTYIQVNGGLVLGTTADTAAAGNHNHDTVYSKLGHTHNVATTSTAGFMSAVDKQAIDRAVEDIENLDQYTNMLALKTHNHNGVYPRFFYSSTEPADAVEGDIWISATA